MSQPGLTSVPARGAVQKQRFNVYTMMLIISFLAILTACILLYVELTRYGEYPWWDTKKAATAPATSSLQGTDLDRIGTESQTLGGLKKTELA